MSINFEIKKETTVDGKDYESLADVPPEVRTAILKTLAHGAKTTKRRASAGSLTIDGVRPGAFHNTSLGGNGTSDLARLSAFSLVRSSGRAEIGGPVGGDGLPLRLTSVAAGRTSRSSGTVPAVTPVLLPPGRLVR